MNKVVGALLGDAEEVRSSLSAPIFINSQDFVHRLFVGEESWVVNIKLLDVGGINCNPLCLWCIQCCERHALVQRQLLEVGHLEVCSPICKSAISASQVGLLAVADR